MAGVDDGQSTLAGVHCGPVRSLAHHQRVDALLDRFSERARIGSCSGADRPATRQATGGHAGGAYGAAMAFGERLRAGDQLGGGELGVTHHADIQRLEAREPGGGREGELPSEEHVVTHLAVRIERQMRCIQRELALEEQANAPEKTAP